ncbi:MAG: Unknown protein [uncultured Sulfurovum sp.]|uniref:Excalibur calcium-binding domain-containing protein n=1 Tax=uncultured Sulfurovum sp. TaxID=269237 RepID=A0A6S6S5M2_9BACT|nr:MAG: Unknown protein [uncultured Sulfurovum sp.]
MILISVLLMAIIWLLSPIITYKYDEYFNPSNISQVYTKSNDIHDNKTVQKYSDIDMDSYDHLLYKHDTTKTKVHREPSTKIIKSTTVLPYKIKSTGKKSNSFKCDHREYCSQMTSYAEAKFFNKYCKNSKMDGDYDGIPCERQFNK